MRADTCLSMADKTVTSEDREILQTAITNNENGINEVEKWTSEIENTQNGEESSSKFSSSEDDWPSGFPLLRMALLGLPRPQPYGTSIRPKPIPSTKTSNANKACDANTEKSSSVEELKPILFVSVKEEEQEPEDCKMVPDWEDDTTEVDSLSDTIYPALLCCPDLESPTSPRSCSGDADEEQTWPCFKVETEVLSSNIEEDTKQNKLKLTDRKRRKRPSQVLQCDCTQKVEDEANHCENYDKIVGSKNRSSSLLKTCDCRVFLVHSALGNLLGTKQFNCAMCGKAFKHLKNLNKHCERPCRKKLHPEVSVHKVLTAKKLACEVCDRKFTTNQHLRNHVLAHTGRRPYTCDLCGCSFIYKSHATRHRLTHTSERYYVCDYCSYSFIQKSNFLLHMRTLACMPTPTAKRVCGICYRAFSKKMYLDSHLKKHASVLISTE